MTPAETFDPDALWRRAQAGERKSAGRADAAHERAKRVPALDGLRLVAVLYVVVFHYWPEWLPGGFVGVDIFFVLSGYLITGILLRQLDANGKIRFREFFWRRACRLMPALCVMVLVTLLVADQGGYDWEGHARRDAAWALTYLSNWQRAYSGKFGDAHFLCHTWSLGVEEQFYLTWPFLLWWIARRGSRRRLLAVSAWLIAAVMVWRWTLAFLGASPYRLYHGFDTRADELLTGCALAVVMTVGEYRAIVIRTLQRLPWLPILLLATLPLVGFGNKIGSVGLTVTGYPIIAACASVVIVACHHLPTQTLSRVLAFPPLVYLGSISYGIYLWHLPMVKLLERGADLGAFQPFAAVALTAVAAALSYHGFERRFMMRRPHPSPPLGKLPSLARS